MNKESWYARKLNGVDVVTISVSDDWIVDYDKNRGMYRVSHFEDNHFKDEHWFDAYEDKEAEDFDMYIEDMENSREFEVKEQLEKERKDIKSFDDLVVFLQRVKDNCNTGYGTAARSIAQAALAVAWYLASDFGITGFQAGFVMWDFIRDWQYSDNECGMKIVNYDDMLYPQYDYKFDKVISKDTFEALQKKAWNLYNDRDAHPAVEKHWESIIHGEVPFGYVIKED